MSTRRPAYERLNPAQLAVLKKKALTDPWAFLELINFHGGNPAFDDIHMKLLSFLSSTVDRRLCLMPRGHFKSTICSTLYVLWRIYLDENIRIMVATKDKEMSTGFVRELKQYLEDENLQKYVWNARPHKRGRLVPDIDRTRRKTRNQDVFDFDESEFGGGEESNDRKVVWRANAIQVLRSEIYKEPTVYASSVGSTMTGWHYDLVLFDDIVTFANSDSIDKANKINEWVQDIESVVNPRNEEDTRGDEIIILGTKYYAWDYYGRLLGTIHTEEEEIVDYWDSLVCDPLWVISRDIYGNGFEGLYQKEMADTVEGLTSENGYMCPRLMNLRKETKLRRRLGLRRFTSQYLNRIMSEADKIFDWDNIKWLNPMGAERMANGVVRVRRTMDSVPIFIKPILVVDPAFSLRNESDLCVVLVGGVDQEKNYYLFACKYGHWTASQLANIIKELLISWNLKGCVIEANGPQVGLVNSVKEVWKTNDFDASILSEIPKGDKKQRILDALEPVFEREAVWMMSYFSSMLEIKSQVETFPAQGGRDDFLDAFEKIVRHAKPLPKSVIKRLMGYRPKLPQRPRCIYGGVYY